MSKRHRVFISYHHFNDERYRRIFSLRFDNRFGSVLADAVALGDISPMLKAETIRRRIRDDYLRDTTVTVLLVGTDTWKRRHIDWEIASSLRDTELNHRSGLLGLLLPTRKDYGLVDYDSYTVPPRLEDNVACGYAVLAHWTNDADTLQGLVHRAYGHVKRYSPDNSRELYRYNRSGSSWK